MTNLHDTVAFASASIFRQDKVTTRLLAEYGLIIDADAFRMFVISVLEMTFEFSPGLDPQAAARLASAPAVSVTLRSAATPSDISTHPR